MIDQNHLGCTVDDSFKSHSGQRRSKLLGTLEPVLRVLRERLEHDGLEVLRDLLVSCARRVGIRGEDLAVDLAERATRKRSPTRAAWITSATWWPRR